MNPNLYDDISIKNNKVVVVYLTSGDAGIGDDNNGGKVPYYQAREIGAVAANRWMADEDHSLPQKLPTLTKEVIAGKTIKVFSYKNTKTYFLRLPDGMFAGEGAPRTGSQSLYKLRQGSINTIGAVDGSAKYRSWQELTGTLEALVRQEARGVPRVVANVQDPDTSTNLRDHSDHTNAGLAALEAVKPFSCVAVARYLDYVTSGMKPNLSDEALYSEIGAFAVMTSWRGNELYDNTWDPEHRIALGRNYFTFLDSAQDCTF